MAISRMQQPRQLYGLGSLVKSIGKTVKKVIKSPIGKAALIGLGGAGLMGMGPLSALGGLGASSGTGIASILSKGKSLLGGLTTGQRLAGSLGLAALASAPQEVQEESSRDIGALKKYLASYYQNLGYSADEIAENVERDTAEYTSGAGGYAEGGRIGYREGNLAMGPGSGFTLKPPGELAYDATNTSIYGSSAASFTPKTIMNQLGNQVQAGFGKTPGMQPGGLTLNPGATIDPIMGKPLPDYMRPGNIPGTDTPYSTLRGGPQAFDNVPNNPFTIRSIEERKQMAEDMNNAPTGLMRADGTRANVTYENISDGRNTMPSMPGNNMSFPRAMPATPVPFQTVAQPMSFGQQPQYGLDQPQMALPALPAQKMPFAQQVNSSSPMAQIAGMADGGRMGYQNGTDPTYTGNNMEDLPRGLQMDTTTSNPIPEESSFMENLTLLNEIKGGVSPSTKIYLLKEFMDKALERGEITEERYNEMLMPFFGETGEGITSQIENFERENFAMGSPEENAVQASGIMDLPLNQNPAGITELDLRETGGFIPPVGVKEKADDIPAMLSNNEFVFTADAVRGMGDGNVNKGAQRMYDMMKKLEKGGRV